MKKLLWCGLVLVLMGMAQAAETTLKTDEKNVTLPAPTKTGGLPLLDALAKRQSTREFGAKTFSLQQISDLLWAGSGVNRADGRMTAPTAANFQELTLFVAAPEGVYRYDAVKNTLEQVIADDIRKATGMQPFVGENTLEIIIIADYTKMRGEDATKVKYAWIDSGYISQNLYLYAASAGLNTVVRAAVNRENIVKALNLPATQEVIVVQTIGFPK